MVFSYLSKRFSVDNKHAGFKNDTVQDLNDEHQNILLSCNEN